MKVLVVGAGWTGVGCAVQLLAAGYDVSLVEELDDVGGTWHPSNCYAGLQLHASAAQIEYHDHPLPPQVDRGARLPSAGVFDYLRSYCRAKGIYERTRFGVRVDRLAFDSRRRETTAHLLSLDSGSRETATFDYVVYTANCSHRTLPAFAGRERFAGEVVHSFDATVEFMARVMRDERRILLLGGSKTATDFAHYLATRGYQHFRWLYRANYWFLRADRYLGSQGGRYSPLAMLRYAAFAASNLPRLQYLLFRLTGEIHTFGPPHHDFRKFHVGSITQDEMAVLRACAAERGIRGEVSGLAGDAVRLADGSSIPADIVICCTGSGLSLKNVIALEADGELVDLSTQREIYRHKVLPRVPTVIFTALSRFSTGTVNGLSMGNWARMYMQLGADEKYLARRSTRCARSPFEAMLLFDSSQHFLQAVSQQIAAHVQGGELRSLEHLRLLDRLARGVAPRPLTFSPPR